MLIAVSVDLWVVISRVLLICSLACCGIVLASFALFAYDQTSGASKHQVASLNGSASNSASRPAAKHEAEPRRFIDGAAHALTSPFRSLLQSNSQWAVWGFATVLALLVYGLGLGLLSRAIRL